MTDPHIRKEYLLRAGLLLLAITCLYALLYILNPFASFQEVSESSFLKMRVLVCALYALPAAYFCLIRRGSWAETALSLASLIFILYLRCGLLDHKTFDHQYHLDLWLDYFANNGGLRGLSNPPGNYNLPYLYIVAAVGSTKAYNLHILLKLAAIPFEFLAAWFVLKIVELRSQSYATGFLAFAASLCLPTVIFNNAYWGQCDIIYTSFILGSLYFLLRSRYAWALAFWGIAFAFKAQAFFIAPLYFALWVCGKIRIQDFLFAPLSYLAIHIPGLFFSYPPARIVGTYLGQFSEVESQREILTNNAPNIYQLFADNIFTKFNEFSTFGVGMTIALVLLISFWLKSAIQNIIQPQQILLIAALFSILVPYILPGMEDRSFFMADVISFVCVFYYKQMLWTAILTSFASWMAYSHFLYGKYWVDFPVLGICNAAALILCFIILYQSFADHQHLAPQAES